MKRENDLIKSENELNEKIKIEVEKAKKDTSLVLEQSYKNKISRFEAEIISLQKIKEQLSEELIISKKQVEQLCINKEQLIDKNSKLKDEIQNNYKQIEELKIQCNIAQDKIKNAEVEINKRSEECDIARTKIIQLDKTICSQNQIIDNEKKTICNYENELCNCKETISVLKMDLKKCESSIKDDMVKIQELINKNQNLERENDLSKRIIAENSMTIHVLNEKLEIGNKQVN